MPPDEPLAMILEAAEAARLRLRTLGAGPSVLTPQDQRDQHEARRLLDEIQALHERAHQAHQDALAASRRAGRAEGYAEALAALKVAHDTHSALLQEAEADLVCLALRVAHRILGRRLEAHPEELAEVVARALDLARGRSRVELRVHPEDLPHLTAHLPRLTQALGQEPRLTADPHLPPRGCHIHTEAGVIEADLDTQLRAVAALLGVEERYTSEKI